MDWYGRPLRRESPISQVRLFEYTDRHPVGKPSRSAESADSLSSGKKKIRSPATPQHPARSGTTTVSAHAPATPRNFSRRPNLIELHVTCTAIVSRIFLNSIASN